MNIYLMRGIPGAGKTTWIINNFPGNTKRIVSADYYFMCDGTYIFNPKQLHDAHRKCFSDFLEILQDTGRWEEINLIVDNTNIEPLDIAPYIAVASVYDLNVTIIEVRIDPEVAAARNEHEVSRKRVLQMAERVEQIKLPLKRWSNVKVIQADEYNNKLQS